MKTGLHYNVSVWLLAACLLFASCTQKKTPVSSHADSAAGKQNITRRASLHPADSMRQYWRDFYASAEKSLPSEEYLRIADSVLRNAKIFFNNDAEIVALSWLSKGFAMRKLSLFDSALICYDIAQSYYEKAGLGDKAINCFYQKGLAYFNRNNYDSGFAVMKSGLKKTLSAHAPDTTLVLKFCNYMSSKYANILEFDSAIHYRDQCEKYFVHPDNLETGLAHSTYLNLSTAYQKTGNFDKATAYLDRALQLAEKMNNEEKIYVSVYNLALLKSETGDYQSSNLLLSKYITQYQVAYDTVTEEKKASLAFELTDMHTISGMNYSSLRETSKSLFHFQKSLDYAKVAFEPNSSSLAEKYINLGDYYSNFTQHWDSVLYYEDMAKQLLQKDDDEYEVLTNYYYLPTCALANAHLGKENEAIEFARSALAESGDSVAGINWKDESDPFAKMSCIQKVAGAYSALYSATFKRTYAERALQLYAQLYEGTDYLIANNDDENILGALDNNSEANKKEIALLWMLSKNNDASYEEKLPAAFERNKSIILKKYYKQQQITGRSTNPLLAELRTFQSRKSELEQQALQDSSFSLTGNETYHSINNKIDSLVGEIDRMMLARNSGNNSDRFDVSSLQKLTGKTAIIDFVIADESVYALTIYKGKSSLHQIEYSKQLRDDLTRFISGLQNNSARNNQSNSLYQQLIYQPFAGDGLPQKLIIIPDGELCNLPFEALTSYQDKDSVRYLADDCSIRYEYCLSFLVSDTTRQNAGGEVLAMAPTFEKAKSKNTQPEDDAVTKNLLYSRPELRAGFGELKFNKEEADAIINTIPGTEVTGSAATEKAFRQKAPGYNILHLATHAYSNPDNPGLSGIVFSINDKYPAGASGNSLQRSLLDEDNILHAYEIQDMNLQASLVVLSACETGIGKYQAGEGTMSLARAFKYAKCPNIITSLWKVNDESTKEIMTGFYDNLGKGMGKADALAAAKQSFRKNNPSASPFYWSAFILIGDNAPVHIQEKSGWGFWMIGLFAVIAVGVAVIAVRKKASPHSP